MIVTAIALFLVAAVFGLYLASRVFSGVLPPWAPVILHGLLAASGLVVLLYALYTGAQGMALIVGAGLLVVAALGGFVMFSYQLRKALPPRGLVVIHALAAVVGVVALLGSALGMA